VIEIYLLYIGIVVAFFLLGLIFGYIKGSKRASEKPKEKPLSETAKNMPEGNQHLGQEANINKSDPQDCLYPNTQRYGYYNYRNYGSSFYTPSERNRPGPR
jgi:hypothetical protein